MDSEIAYKPRISLNSTELPEMKKWEIGKTYDVIVKVKYVGVHEQYGKDGTYMGEFEVQKAMVAGEDEKDLDDIVDLADNNDFLRASGNYRKNRGY